LVRGAALALFQIGRCIEGQQRDFGPFFADIFYPVALRGGFPPAIGLRFLIGLGNSGVVGDGDHPHPAAETPHGVDGIERLRAAGDLQDVERENDDFRVSAATNFAPASAWDQDQLTKRNNALTSPL
jgi:hypothetical protein